MPLERTGIRRARSVRSRDDGAGAALVIGVVAAIIIVTLTTLPLSLAYAESRRLAGTADAAALAAADTASGALAGVPCEAAASVARIQGAALDSCEVSRAIASVTVSGEAAGIALTARSRAGPPSLAAGRHVVGGSRQD
ncbi:MAG: Rv3654c family TadE-like protein [Naasia sp.]